MEQVAHPLLLVPDLAQPEVRIYTHDEYRFFIPDRQAGGRTGIFYLCNIAQQMPEIGLFEHDPDTGLVKLPLDDHLYDLNFKGAEVSRSFKINNTISVFTCRVSFPCARLRRHGPGIHRKRAP